jgi:hypothetical protein
LFSMSDWLPPVHFNKTDNDGGKARKRLIMELV